MILKILRNALSLLTGHGISKLFSMAGIIFLARYLGVQKFGLYGTLMAYLTLFATIADNGLTTVTVREVAQDRARSNSFFSNTLTLRLILSLVAYLLMLFLGSLWKRGEFSLLFMASCALFIFPEALRKLSIAMLSAYERMEIVAVLEVFSTAFRYIPFLIIILLGKSFHTAFIFLVIGWFCLSGTFLFITKKLCLKEYVFHVDRNQLRKILYAGFPFGILFIVNIIHFKADIIMLSKMQGSMAVGFYEGAYRFIEASVFIPISIVNVLLPVMSRSFVTDKTAYANVFIHSARILATGILPVIILVSFFSQEIILLVLGNAYLPSVPALALLIWALFFMFLNAPMDNIIITSKKMRAFLPYSIGNALLNICLNFLLIPKYSFLGASFATVFTKLTMFIVKLYFAHSVLDNISYILKIIIKLAVAGMITSILCYTTKPIIMFPFNAILIVGVYIINIFVLKVISPDDKRLYVELIGIIKNRIALKRKVM